MSGDRYAGETFRADFERASVTYRAAKHTVSELYERLEPLLNGGRCVVLDEPALEQQLLGLVWRGAKIDHPAGEHDDYANAVCGALLLASRPVVEYDGTNAHSSGPLPPRKVF